LAYECDMEIPDEFFDLNPEFGREDFENGLLKRFDNL